MKDMMLKRQDKDVKCDFSVSVKLELDSKKFEYYALSIAHRDEEPLQTRFQKRLLVNKTSIELKK